jgi:hypothetical protein
MLARTIAGFLAAALAVPAVARAQSVAMPKFNCVQ